MAHEITETDHMVSANNVVPWHGLGTVLDGNLSAAQAIDAAKLSWEVEQEPLYDGDMNVIASHQINRRSDTKDILGIVSSTWTPVQNTFLVELAEALGQANLDFQPVIETAGSLRGGRIVWAMIKTSERTFADSAHREYLLLSNCHAGTRAVRGTLTDVRVVCNNTLSAAEAASSHLMVSHTKNVEQRLKEAVDLLSWTNDATDATFAIYEALAAKRIEKDRLSRIFTGIATKRLARVGSKAADKVVEEFMDLYENGTGNSGETAFDALNAVTEWVDHRREYRESDRTAESRMEFTTFGGFGRYTKKFAMEVLAEA